jgi:hypothetical protein
MVNGKARPYTESQVFSLKHRPRPVGGAARAVEAGPGSLMLGAPLAVGDAVEILDLDGERKPHLAGKQGTISHIRHDGIPVVVVDDVPYKGSELWWKRL